MDKEEALSKLDVAYLIMGSEELEKEKRIEKLLNLFEGDFADFNREIIRPESDCTVHQLQAALDALPVMSDKRLLYLKDIDQFDKSLIELVIAYLANPFETTVLLASAKKLAKNTRLYKAFHEAVGAHIICCEEKNVWELERELIKLAAQHGLQLKSDAAQQLIALKGKSLIALDTELARLSLLFPAQHSLSCAEVQAHVARTAQPKPWPILDACSQRKLDTTLMLIKLMPAQSELSLFYLLVERLRELKITKIFLRSGKRGELNSFLSKQDWQTKSYASWEKNYSSSELSAALHSSFDCERKLKSSADKNLVLSQWLISFM